MKSGLKFSIPGLAAKLALLGAGLISFSACAPSLKSSSKVARGVVAADQVIAPSSREGQSTVLVILVEQVAGGLKMKKTCTGSIIAKDLIVTAAHCLLKEKASAVRDPETVVVYFGAYHDGQSLKTLRAVSAAQVKIHPNFSATWRAGEDGFDVGLIKLSGPLFQGYTAAPILTSNFALRTGQAVSVAGDGNPKFQGAYVDEILRGFMDYKIEGRSAPQGTMITLRSLSAGGISDGDSGGPGFVALNGNTYLWGVASSSEAGGYGRAFYVDLRRFKSWILHAATAMNAPFEFNK